MAITKGQFGGLTGAMYEDAGGCITLTSSPHVTIGHASTITTTAGGTGSISPMRTPAEVILDRYQLNEITVQHRVQEFELMKLRESNVDYATEIKHNLAKHASEEVTNKMTFTKKTEIDSDTHSFRGRVWVFSKEELIKMIEEIRNGI
jgi:hypothetical protein